MFLRDSARVWCGMRRYSSRRMTEGTRMEKRAECRKWPFSSSVMATPFSTSTMARRAAHTLMGSYDAFSTSTGACITVRRGSPWAPVVSRMTVACVACPVCRPLLINLCGSGRRRWNQPRCFSLQHSRHGGDKHLLGAGAHQHPRALAGGDAGSEYIIYHHDRLIDYCVSRYSKCAANIGAPLMARQPGLRFGGACAPQNSGLDAALCS